MRAQWQAPHGHRYVLVLLLLLQLGAAESVVGRWRRMRIAAAVAVIERCCETARRARARCCSRVRLAQLLLLLLHGRHPRCELSAIVVWCKTPTYNGRCCCRCIFTSRPLPSAVAALSDAV